MYLPSQFAETRPAQLHRVIQEHSLGMLVTHTAAGLDANHLPFLLDADHGTCGVLVAHVARKNTVWQEVADGDEVLVVFRGVQGYISPNWYPGKQDTHRRVPTWNYEVVHAHGTIHVHDDATYVRGVVARLTRQHEASEPRPWKMGDAPSDYIADHLSHIVGIEIRLTHLEGKRKLNQHHETRDREGAIHDLEDRGNTGLAEAMRQAATKPNQER
jgi:transcriptional regulator